MEDKTYRCLYRTAVEEGRSDEKIPFKCFKCDGHGNYSVAGMERDCLDYFLIELKNAKKAERVGSREAVLIIRKGSRN